jgi:hypothetical protein
MRNDALLKAVRHDLSSVIDVAAPTWDVDSSAREVAAYRLLHSVVKKYQETTNTTPDQDRTAQAKFERFNARCADWSDRRETEIDEVLVGGFRRAFTKFSECSAFAYDYGRMYTLGRCGPGASIGATGKDFYSKWFDSRLSVTPRLLDVWKVIVRRRYNLSETIADGCRRKNRGSYAIESDGQLFFVPKNDSTSRVVITQPTINMWLQLGFGSMIEAALLQHFGISIQSRGCSGESSLRWVPKGDESFDSLRPKEHRYLAQPDANRELAYLGSIDGSYATVDLESASDSISLGMCRQNLPRQFMSILEVLRTNGVTSRDGKHQGLNMVATMGNGYTFPLMTSIIACVVESVYESLGIPLVRGSGSQPGNFAVFGDDIIVVTRAVGRLYRLLDLLGFVVNADKSFVEGPFRESCGADFYLGTNVRPVFVKKLRSNHDVFVAINTLARWCALHKIDLRWTMRLLLRWLIGDRPRRDSCAYAVPLHASDDSGLTMPSSVSHGRRTPQGTWVYTCHVPKQHMLVFDDLRCTVRADGETKVPSKLRRRNYSPFGRTLASVVGYIRGDRLVLKVEDETVYGTEERVSINWDYGLAATAGHRQVIRPDELVTVWERILS